MEVGNLNTHLRTVDPFISHTTESHFLKLLFINCHSLRSLCIRNQLASILSHHNIDIILGCESHSDEMFLSVEILQNTYKIIGRDRSLSGGSVFIGFKNSLQLSEVGTLTYCVSDAIII